MKITSDMGCSRVINYPEGRKVSDNQVTTYPMNIEAYNFARRVQYVFMGTMTTLIPSIAIRYAANPEANLEGEPTLLLSSLLLGVLLGSRSESDREGLGDSMLITIGLQSLLFMIKR